MLNFKTQLNKSGQSAHLFFQFLGKVIFHIPEIKHYATNKPDYRFLTSSSGYVFCELLPMLQRTELKGYLRVDDMAIPNIDLELSEAGAHRPGRRWVAFNITQHSELSEAYRLFEYVYRNFPDRN